MKDRIMPMDGYPKEKIIDFRSPPRLSEIIAALEAFKEEFGDIPVEIGFEGISRDVANIHTWPKSSGEVGQVLVISEE